ncbi:MAG: glycosyltransferase family 2 protein [Patescibacteria group bacterium]
MISIVVPIYNEEETIRELHRRMVQAMAGQTDSYELVFVDDGSTDNTREIMKTLRPLKAVFLQKNYGETPALEIGVQEAEGDIIVFSDADLQDDPAEIPKMLEKIGEGYDVVVGWRKNRKDHWTRRLFSYFANHVLNCIAGMDIHDFGCGLKAYKSVFIKDFKIFGYAQPFLPAVAKERGAKIYEMEVAHSPRQSGSSKIKLSHIIKGGFDVLSVAFFIKYFFKPLRFFGGWGAVSVLLSILVFATAIALRLLGILHFTETPLPVVGSLFASLGILLFMMGLLAEILLRTYYLSTNRSPYIIKEIKKNE